MTAPAGTTNPIGWKILQHLDETSESDIEAFRKKIVPIGKAAFERFETEDRKRCVTLDKLSEEAVIELIKIQVRQGILVGIHDVCNLLGILWMLTNAEKYMRLLETMKTLKKGDLPKNNHVV